MFVFKNFVFKKLALTGATTAVLLGGGVVAAGAASAAPFQNQGADPMALISVYSNPALDNARTVAQNVVNGLKFLSANDKAYYTAAIGIATDQAQINGYVSQAISDDNFIAAHPNR
ncbi:MAG: hypothetical protein Q3972_04905 [Corynebacterium sp.]|nr:hypothetical protein [Corynebacterium sp.]